MTVIADVLQKVARRQPLTLLEQDIYGEWLKSQDDAAKKVSELEAQARRIDGVMGSIVPAGQASVTKVSQISNDLGDMIAGRFIAPASTATSTEPTNAGFTGAFMSGDGETFDGELWHVGGVSAGALQFGLSAEDGKAYAGAGAVVIDGDGVTIEADTTNEDSREYKFANESGNIIARYWALKDISNTRRSGIQTLGNQTAPAGGAITDILALSYNSLDATIQIRTLSYPGGCSAFILLQSNQSTGTITLNHTGQDVDVVVKGNSDDQLTVWDAGLEAVGIGGAAESGYKLKVHGDVNITSGNTYDINGSPHTHGSVVPINLHGLSTAVPASSTRYLSPVASGLISSYTRFFATRACTLKNLYLNLTAADTQPVSGSLQCVVEVNGVNTALAYTLAAGASGGVFSNTSDTVAVAMGDLIILKFIDNATSDSVRVSACAFEEVFDTE